MVCSGGKGGSKWLDRLRSSKDSSSSSSSAPMMDHSSSSSPSSLNPKPAGAGAASSSSSSFAVITGILSDLFYITPPTTVSASNKKTKKFPRKQASPKNLSNPKQPPPPPPPPRTVSASSPPIPIHNPKQQQTLSGFSKTEVTVIDTSSLLWKSDKLIFRRKHVWKIKDKNNKTNFSPSQPHRRFHSNLPHQQIQEYDGEHCSGPDMTANAPESSNDKKQNASTPLHGNHTYDPQTK